MPPSLLLFLQLRNSYFDPITKQSSPIDEHLRNARGTEHVPNAVLLGDGRVLFAGGYGNTGELNAAELFDPDASKFQNVAGMAVERACHALTVLPDGNVLVTGGYNETSKHLVSAEIYDVAKNRFSLIANMNTPHCLHTATLMPNNEVLIVGGMSNVVEVYDPIHQRFRTVGHLQGGRTLHTAVVNKDGRVYIIGGTQNGPQTLASVDIFTCDAGE